VFPWRYRDIARSPSTESRFMTRAPISALHERSRRRKSIMLGAGCLVRVRISPKSVSAEISTRLSRTARARTSSSGGAGQATLDDMDSVVGAVAKELREPRREAPIDEELHDFGGQADERSGSARSATPGRSGRCAPRRCRLRVRGPRRTSSSGVSAGLPDARQACEPRCRRRSARRCQLGASTGT